MLLETIRNISISSFYSSNWLVNCCLSRVDRSIFFSQHSVCETSCYVMLWPALTWRGQEWAQHVQGQLLHACIMQMAGSHHVMELPLTVYKCRASIVKLFLSITFVLRAVLCAVRIKLQKEIAFLRVLLYCMTKSYPLEQFPHP